MALYFYGRLLEGVLFCLSPISPSPGAGDRWRAVTAQVNDRAGGSEYTRPGFLQALPVAEKTYLSGVPNDL